MDRLSERPQKGGELILQRRLHHQNGEDGVDEQGQLHDPGVDGAESAFSASSKSDDSSDRRASVVDVQTTTPPWVLPAWLPTCYCR